MVAAQAQHPAARSVLGLPGVILELAPCIPGAGRPDRVPYPVVIGNPAPARRKVQRTVELVQVVPGTGLAPAEVSRLAPDEQVTGGGVADVEPVPAGPVLRSWYSSKASENGTVSGWCRPPCKVSVGAPVRRSIT